MATARTPGEANECLSTHTPLKAIVTYVSYSAREMEILVDNLLRFPNSVEHLELSETQLGERAGKKLARYVAGSTTLKMLDISHTFVNEKTYLCLAHALRTNTSLRYLYATNTSKRDDFYRIDGAFISALRLNPNRPSDSIWYFSSFLFNHYEALKPFATPPSMILLLETQEEPAERRQRRAA